MIELKLYLLFYKVISSYNIMIISYPLEDINVEVIWVLENKVDVAVAEVVVVPLLSMPPLLLDGDGDGDIIVDKNWFVKTGKLFVSVDEPSDDVAVGDTDKCDDE